MRRILTPRLLHRSVLRKFNVFLLTITMLMVQAIAAPAHEIPADARLNVFVAPHGNELDILVRAPLASMSDVEFPFHGGGYLDVSRADAALGYAAKLWLVQNLDAFENDQSLGEAEIVAVRASLPSDHSFVKIDQAIAHFGDPKLADSLDVTWNQLLIDTHLRYRISSDRSDFSLRLRVDKFGQKVVTALRFVQPDGATRALEFDSDTGLIHLDPSWRQAAAMFVREGIGHILSGIDHLLFLACLVIPFRRLRPLLVIVTAFTVAHSISLLASAFGFVPDALWFPPLVETLIAVTIVYMGLENIVGSNARRRWILTFAFGLIHGFGFSFALRESLQFAGDHLLASLLAFNLGVEIGQIAVLLVLVPALSLLFRHAVPERTGIVILSALIVHTAWHWMLERGADVLRFPFPTIDAALIASAMRGALALTILAALVWLVNGIVKRWLGPQADAPTPTMMGAFAEKSAQG